MHIGTTQTNRGIPLYALLETMTSDPHAAHFNLPDLILMMRSQVCHVIRHNLCKLQQ
jgi:hypothetical protein